MGGGGVGVQFAGDPLKQGWMLVFALYVRVPEVSETRMSQELEHPDLQFFCRYPEEC